MTNRPLKFARCRIILGIVMIMIGTIFILQNLEIISFEIWHLFWPSLLILFGIAIIFRNRGFPGHCCYGYEKTRNEVLGQQ